MDKEKAKERLKEYKNIYPDTEWQILPVNLTEDDVKKFKDAGLFADERKFGEI